TFTNPGDPKGTIDISTSPPTLKLTSLKVPGFKGPGGKAAMAPPFKLNKKPRPNDQRSVWLGNEASKTKSAEGVEDRAKELNVTEPYMFQGHAAKSKSEFAFFGKKEDIAGALVIPPWSRSGGFHLWDVDHKKEWQLGGDNDVKNMWLLDPK